MLWRHPGGIAPGVPRDARGKGKLRLGRIDPLNLGRRTALYQQLSEGAAAAADVDPA